MSVLRILFFQIHSPSKCLVPFGLYGPSRSNLELEGQGQGIIMGVTRLLLLGPFYTIQTKTDKTFWRAVYHRAYSSRRALKAASALVLQTELGILPIFVPVPCKDSRFSIRMSSKCRPTGPQWHLGSIEWWVDWTFGSCYWGKYSERNRHRDRQCIYVCWKFVDSCKEPDNS